MDISSSRMIGHARQTRQAGESSVESSPAQQEAPQKSPGEADEPDAQCVPQRHERRRALVAMEGIDESAERARGKPRRQPADDGPRGRELPQAPERARENRQRQDRDPGAADMR